MLWNGWDAQDASVVCHQMGLNAICVGDTTICIAECCSL